jgi:hypothetical protein
MRSASATWVADQPEPKRIMAFTRSASRFSRSSACASRKSDNSVSGRVYLDTPLVYIFQRTTSSFYAKFSCAKSIQQLIEQKKCSQKPPVAGFEIEAWLVNDTMKPVPYNQAFLKTFNNPLATTELAQFNIELNNQPLALSNNALSQFHQELDNTWRAACQAAATINAKLLMIGTLPTLQQSDLTLSNTNPNKFLIKLTHPNPCLLA